MRVHGGVVRKRGVAPRMDEIRHHRLAVWLRWRAIRTRLAVVWVGKEGTRRVVNRVIAFWNIGSGCVDRWCRRNRRRLSVGPFRRRF